MLVPITWLKDFVDIDIPIELLAHKLTMAGLEVEEIRFVGLPLPAGISEGISSEYHKAETKITGFEWDPDKLVVAAVLEVMPHPNADRLVLCRLDDGQQEHVVLTGATNLFPYKGAGPLETAMKVPYAREGANIFDGHQAGQVLVTLKRKKIRGVESSSMICSEKELGLSDEHEGIIVLDSDAPIGNPLVDYMGDAVLDITLTPNIARTASILGIAREVSAITDKPLRYPDFEIKAQGPSIEGQVSIEITNPELNPRFVLGLINEVNILPSPYWVQRRLRLAGMRPINNVVDATNYAMLEVGQPLHAFDFDILNERAGSDPPTIITRTANRGERLTTLDDIERELDDYTVLVCDSTGPVSIAGVMGGIETEVHERSQSVLLEGAAWNFINIRRTISAQSMDSEAAYRFSRGVHPSVASFGVKRCLELMRQWTNGVVAQGLIDNYQLPPEDPKVKITPQDVKRWLGIELSSEKIANILSRLEFKVEINDNVVQAKTPDHRLDIGEGVVGVADILEEIARVYGYENIPESRMADELPPAFTDPNLSREERIRDVLVSLGFQEVVNYRMTSKEREARLVQNINDKSGFKYVNLLNPIASDRDVLRRSLLSSVLEVVERNVRLRERMALFEIGPVFSPGEGEDLPAEDLWLAVVLTGQRSLPAWQTADTAPMDYYDLKGKIEALFDHLRIADVNFESVSHPSYHPGRCAQINFGEARLGVMGELHPLTSERHDFPDTPVLAAELDIQVLMQAIPDRYPLQPVPAYPPVLEDLAFVLDETIPAESVRQFIKTSGGAILTEVELFDVYRGDQVESGKKSLAFNLSYQEADRTLTDEEVHEVRKKIILRMEEEFDAYLRA